jgi:hypothetical protein
MDQFNYPKDLIELATYTGKYRKALVTQGVPDALADLLVRDWHDRALGSTAPQLNSAAMRLTDVEHIGKT